MGYTSACKTTILLCAFTLFSEAFSLNATLDIDMLEYPEAIKAIKVGEKLELHWKYRINTTTRNKWKIGLFVYNYTTGTKIKLLMLLESGVTVSNPFSLPITFPRLNMELSHENAKISIPAAATIGDSTGYGISFQAIGGSGADVDKPLEKFTEVSIVGIEGKSEEMSARLRGSSSRPWPFQFLIFLVLISMWACDWVLK